MRTGPILLACLLGAALPGAAQAQRLAPIKGGKLLQLCENGRARTVCDAYVSGVADGIAGLEHMMSKEQGHDFAGATCIPVSTSAETLRTTVIDFIRAHSEDQDKPAAVPTFEALHAAFPCQSNG